MPGIFPRDLPSAQPTDYLPACLSAGPVELPLVLRTHGHPPTLLHVGDDDGLVHVGAVGHLGCHADGGGDGVVRAGGETEYNRARSQSVLAVFGQ